MEEIARAHTFEPTVSVVVPVFNGGQMFERCLQSLSACDPGPCELIVVADGDTDGSRRVAAQYHARVLTVANNHGPAWARNLGARHARGDILFFVDSDVAVYPDTIGKVAEVFAANPELDAIFGSYDDQPAAPNFCSQYKNLLNHYMHQTARTEATTFWGGCGAVRQELFLAIGGFDPSYCWMEDIDLGYRLKRGGHRINLIKDLQVTHLKCWRPWPLLRSDFFHRALPWTKLIVKHRQFNNDLNLRWSGRASVGLAYLMVLALAGVWWWPWSAAVVAGLGIMLLGTNAGLYRFFWRKRGLRFALATIPWHWLYFLYGGFGFAIGLMTSMWHRPAPLPRLERSETTVVAETGSDST